MPVTTWLLLLQETSLFLNKKKKLSLTEFIEEVFWKTFHTILKISTFITKKYMDAKLTFRNKYSDNFFKNKPKLTNFFKSIWWNIDLNFSLIWLFQYNLLFSILVWTVFWKDVFIICCTIFLLCFCFCFFSCFFSLVFCPLFSHVLCPFFKWLEYDSCCVCLFLIYFLCLWSP